MTTLPGAWCVTPESQSFSPSRPMAHFFPELEFHQPALRMTALCKARFMLRREVKDGEKPDLCPVCEESAKENT